MREAAYFSRGRSPLHRSASVRPVNIQLPAQVPIPFSGVLYVLLRRAAPACLFRAINSGGEDSVFLFCG